eukprot:2638676-Pleurochrysis_carterae.AAC.2
MSQQEQSVHGQGRRALDEEGHLGRHARRGAPRARSCTACRVPPLGSAAHRSHICITSGCVNLSTACLRAAAPPGCTSVGLSAPFVRASPRVRVEACSGPWTGKPPARHRQARAIHRRSVPASADASRRCSAVRCPPPHAAPLGNAKRQLRVDHLRRVLVSHTGTAARFNNVRLLPKVQLRP